MSPGETRLQGEAGREVEGETAFPGNRALERVSWGGRRHRLATVIDGRVQAGRSVRSGWNGQLSQRMTFYTRILFLPFLLPSLISE